MSKGGDQRTARLVWFELGPMQPKDTVRIGPAVHIFRGKHLVPRPPWGLSISLQLMPCQHCWPFETSFLARPVQSPSQPWLMR